MDFALSIDVVFDCSLWGQSRLGARNLVRTSLEQAWRMTPKKPKGVFPEVTVTLTDDAHIRILNRDFRQKDKPTNVLSFPMWGHLSEIPAHSGAIPLGDIFIAFETMKREAAEQEKSLKDHFIHMTTHGFLHLLGFDHIKDEDASVMENLEIRILKEHGIKNPYV